MSKQDHTKVVRLAPQKLKTRKFTLFERGSEGQERDLDSITYELLNSMMPWLMTLSVPR